jgi:hypothetical protein
MDWATHVTLNSDHLPITITLPPDQPPQAQGARTYTNFKKADWPRFIRKVKNTLRAKPLPTSAACGGIFFREALLKSAKKSIPAGHV